MKKVFAMFLLGTMVSLAACQEKKAETATTTDSTAVIDTTTAVDTTVAADTAAADTTK
ncbi:MAG: hypothetical protein QM669_07850 [Siphonobacter sp.]